MDRIESIILRSLMKEDGYSRRVLPHISEKFFGDRMERILFSTIREYIIKYKKLPAREAISVELDDTPGIAQDDYEAMATYLDQIITESPENTNETWLVERTETWCQEKALYNAVKEALDIIEDKSGKKAKGMIPKLLQDALATSFDPHVGHDYIEDADSRFDFYHKVEKRIPFHLAHFNAITRNGVPSKTLNVVLAGTNVGKSLYLCDLASHYLTHGKNVLYITLEMAEERIAERIDANLMDIALDDLPQMTKSIFTKRIDRINARSKGKLIIKEYPTATANVIHFRALLNDLSLKKNFNPAAIFIDYLNICTSSRIKGNGSGGMYELVKSIAEELRGMAVEYNVPIWTATQMNRAGFGSNDPDLTNTSESFGLPATADFMFALVATDDLTPLNQILVKILKNRYGNVNKLGADGKSMGRFVVGIDRGKMKLYNLEPTAQAGLNNAALTPSSSQAQLPQDNVDDDTIDPDDDTPPWEEPKPKPSPAPVFDIDLPETTHDGDDALERRRENTEMKGLPYSPVLTHTGRPRNKLVTG